MKKEVREAAARSKGNEENAVKMEMLKLFLSVLDALLPHPKVTQPEVFQRIMLCSLSFI